jgi:hypothetical protein
MSSPHEETTERTEMLDRMDDIKATTEAMLDRLTRVESRLTRTMQHLGLNAHGDPIAQMPSLTQTTTRRPRQR